MVVDRLARPLRSLRLSFTDRCNLRCVYCMPEEDYAWLPGESLLTADEIVRLARLFVGLGAPKLRVTGGEPLLRPDAEAIVGRLASEAGAEDLALTTNGVLFGPRAAALRRAGLSRVTLSIDTLRAERAERMSRSRRHADVLAAVGAAAEAGFCDTKVNAVIVRGHNDDELLDLLDFARERAVELRFIEYMDVGGATRWSMRDVVSRAEMLERIAATRGPVAPLAGPTSSAPAERFRLPDGQVFGVIASTTAPFCRKCDRSRLTADGVWLTCLYAGGGLDLRGPLRAGASDDELARLVTGAWEGREDRGAEQRARAAPREALVPVSRLRADPHREMHTRGG